MTFKRVVGTIFFLWFGFTQTFAGESACASLHADRSEKSLPKYSSHTKKISLLKAGDSSSIKHFAANEIIVKFKEPAANKLAQSLQKDGRNNGLLLPGSFGSSGSKHRIRNVKQLFPRFDRDIQNLKTLAGLDATRLNKTQKKLLQRQNRVSSYTTGPALDRIFKLEVELPEGQSIEDVVAAYNRNPDVEYAELNYIVSINLVPNDPLFPLQWSLNNTGQMYPESGRYNHPPGTPDADIDAPEGWDVSTGLTEVVIAVVDTGVYYNHRDLQNNRWINPDEYNGLAGVDDDDNGFVDDIYGYDFCNDDSDPFDDNGHGTHCAGIIAADANNSLDITGICRQGRIMALKFIDRYGYGSVGDAVAAFYYAVENGADVISNSWGGGEYSQLLQDAINYAYSRGVIVVAAAGNSNSNTLLYPAACDNVISVAATNSNDQKAPFSSYGEWVDIAAPGVDILSLRPVQTYSGVAYNAYTSIASGTSMACPCVAGACASLISANPTLTSEEIYEMVVQSGDPIADGICWSDKRINLLYLLSGAQPSKGRLSLDKNIYSCSDVIKIRLGDYDLAGAGSQPVTLTTISTDRETVVLIEDAAKPGVFTGEIPTATGPANVEDGTLQLSFFDIMYAAYEDADDGSGNPATVRVTVSNDCIPPSITNINLQRVGAGGAIVQVSTNEKTTVCVRYGQECGGPFMVADDNAGLSLSHTIRIKGLQAETRYYFVVDANDIIGNHTRSDNGGSCYSFVTGAVTEVFVPEDFNKIQEAMDAVWDGDIVTVLDGTYTGLGNRDLDFKGNAITVRSQNGPANCIIDCAGTQTEPHRAFYFSNQENGYSIVNGFTIKNGYAVYEGGAIRCYGSSPAIEDCIFVSNSAGDIGGAICNMNGSLPVIKNCIFRQNRTRSQSLIVYGGGAVCNILRSDSFYDGCSFFQNSSNNDGGAMFNWESKTSLLNCTFAGNKAYYYGGAILNLDSDITMINCMFSGNTSEGESGGAICNVGTDAELINCTVGGNNASYVSGGVANIDDCSTVIGNCILWGNSVAEIEDMNSQISGGLLNISYSCIQGLEDEWMANGNLACDPLFLDPDGHDDIIGTEDDRLTLLINSPCIDAGNNFLLPQSITTDLDGCERFDDEPDINDTGFGTAPIVDMGAFEGPRQYFLLDRANFIVPEGATAEFTVELAINPEKTVEVSVVFESGDPDITVESGSVLVFGPSDYNQPKTVVLAAAEDEDYLNGNAVINVSAEGIDTVSVKAVEEDITIPPAVLFVDVSASGANDGSDWTNAFNNLVDALQVASRPGHAVQEILVAEGIYKPAVSGGSQQEAFKLINGLSIYGGFPAGGGSWQQRDVKIFETILSGDLNDDDETDFSNMNDNCNNVVIATDSDPNAVLDGFVITSGRMSGMKNFSASPTVINCTFSYNFSIYGGGMLNLENSSPLISNCIFEDNFADFGGGMCNRSNSNPIITDCLFSQNYAGSGAGITNEDSSPDIKDCSFKDNLSDNSGGAVYNLGNSAPVFSGCIFTGNMSSFGGGINNDGNSEDPIVLNCTFYNNYAFNLGGGIYNDSNTMPRITNCISWNNTDKNGKLQSSQIYGGNPVINYSCVMGLDGSLGGTGNIGDNPLLANPSFGDFHLKSQAGRWQPESLSWVTDTQTSPCIDAGDPNMSFGREFWPHGKRINMGAFGGTIEASMSLSGAGNAADLNNDGVVDRKDKVIAAKTLATKF